MLEQKRARVKQKHAWEEPENYAKLFHQVQHVDLKGTARLGKSSVLRINSKPKIFVKFGLFFWFKNSFFKPKMNAQLSKKPPEAVFSQVHSLPKTLYFHNQSAANYRKFYQTKTAQKREQQK